MVKDMTSTNIAIKYKIMYDLLIAILTLTLIHSQRSQSRSFASRHRFALDMCSIYYKRYYCREIESRVQAFY